MRPPFFILSSSRRVRKTVHWYLGQNRQPGTEEQTRRFQKKNKNKNTNHRRGARLHRWEMVCAEPGPESRAPRDQSKRRHREERLRCFFSSLLSSNCPPIFYLSLAAVSSAPLLSPPPISYLPSFPARSSPTTPPATLGKETAV